MGPRDADKDAFVLHKVKEAIKQITGKPYSQIRRPTPLRDDPLALNEKWISIVLARALLGREGISKLTTVGDIVDLIESIEDRLGVLSS